MAQNSVGLVGEDDSRHRIAPPPIHTFDHVIYLPPSSLKTKTTLFSVDVCFSLKCCRVGSGVASSQQGTGRLGVAAQALPEPPTAVIQVRMHPLRVRFVAQKSQERR